MRKNIFLGSRTHVYSEAKKMGVQFEHIFALKNSLLESMLVADNVEYRSFDMAQKYEVLDFLYQCEFDVLISNGCPILFPVEKFKPNQILVNIHPTYLPFLQGKTPLNGVFYNEYPFYGATMHLIDANIDTGNIVYQHREELTEDIDLGLLYYLSFELEGFVFRKGWEILRSHDFNYLGERQRGKGDYFNRTKDKQTVDFRKMDNREIQRRVKSFGIGSQGCIAYLEKEKLKVFEVQEIIHRTLLKKFKENSPGEILLEYDNKLLVRTKDGILKVARFQKIP